MATSYSKATIGADRNQKSFKYSLSKFMELRGATAIVTLIIALLHRMSHPPLRLLLLPPNAATASASRC